MLRNECEKYVDYYYYIVNIFKDVQTGILTPYVVLFLSFHLQLRKIIL